MLGVPAGTVAIWADSGGHRLPWLAAAASLTGLGAALMVLHRVILIARFAPLERTYGQSTLTRAHRWGGAAFLSLMIMHIVVITLAHAEAGLIAAVTGLARFAGAVPVMTLAAVASLTFLVVAACSERAIRDRFGYERWHALHTNAYLALGLSIPHAVVFGLTLGSPGWAQASLLALVGVVYLALIAFRVAVLVVLGLPARGSPRRPP
jgi:predicted ferric reductase